MLLLASLPLLALTSFEIFSEERKVACNSFAGLKSWEGKVPPHPMNHDSGRRAGEFAIQRRSRLRAQAMKVCRNASDAEDLVQEAILRFIQTFEKAEQLPDPRSCEVWLVNTLKNLFFDQCRKRKVQEQGASDPRLTGEVLAFPEHSVQPLYTSITDEEFAQALRALSPKMRATFELHVSGMKYQDIARAQSIPTGTVSKRLHDARMKLRALLKKYSRWGDNS